MIYRRVSHHNCDRKLTMLDTWPVDHPRGISLENSSCGLAYPSKIIFWENSMKMPAWIKSETRAAIVVLHEVNYLPIYYNRASLILAVTWLDFYCAVSFYKIQKSEWSVWRHSSNRVTWLSRNEDLTVLQFFLWSLLGRICNHLTSGTPLRYCLMT